MAYITNVYFPQGVELDGTKIRPGMNTQIRWDFGAGELHIDGQGKVMPNTCHCDPLGDDQARAFEQELQIWTGVMDTNMGPLFFKEGQLVHLDLSDEAVGQHFLNSVFTDWQGPIPSGSVQKIMSLETWELFEAALVAYRDQLTRQQIGNYPYKLAREAYRTRSNELIDPFWEQPLHMHSMSGQPKNPGTVTVTFTETYKTDMTKLLPSPEDFD